MINNVAMIGMEPLLIVLLVVLVLFGGKKIPELMRGVGQGVGELQKGLDEGRAHLTASLREESTPAPITTSSSTPAPTPVATPVETKPAEDHEKFHSGSGNTTAS